MCDFFLPHPSTSSCIIDPPSTPIETGCAEVSTTVDEKDNNCKRKLEEDEEEIVVDVKKEKPSADEEQPQASGGLNVYSMKE